MYRNLDMAALRSLVAIADTGGVTSAAAKLHLTQSAVSMQIKRMEMILDQSLMDRVGRKVALSRDGEQLLGYARRMIAMNDEVWGRLTSPRFEGEIKFGLPYDIIYPYIPDILQRFKAAYPRVKIRLKSWNTKYLKKKFAESVPDIILTTELPRDGTGELLRTERLGWYSASGGKIWQQRPLPVSFYKSCIFRQTGIAALDAAGLSWEQTLDPEGFCHAHTAFISADIAVVCCLRGAQQADWAEVPAKAGLPELPEYGIFQYVRDDTNPMVAELATMIRAAYGVRATAGKAPTKGKGPNMGKDNLNGENSAKAIDAG